MGKYDYLTIFLINTIYQYILSKFIYTFNRIIIDNIYIYILIYQIVSLA